MEWRSYYTSKSYRGAYGFMFLRCAAPSRIHGGIILHVSNAKHKVLDYIIDLNCLKIPEYSLCSVIEVLAEELLITGSADS